MPKNLKLIYALKNGVLTSIENVEKGKACNCICAACGEELIAKKGNKNMHHFAHQAGGNCEYGYESSLHLMAKEVLEKAQKMTLPAVYVNFPQSYKKRELISDVSEICIERVELEKRINTIVPDIVVHAGGKHFFVEIFVTHEIDESKLEKIREIGVSTIEIDLSKQEESMTLEQLAEILLGESERKQWKYNALENKYLQMFLRAAEKKDIVSRGFAMHVDNCPINARTWRGKSYANFIEDCLYCKYCISNTHEGGILCSGRTRISAVHDFFKDEKERIEASDRAIEAARKNEIANKRCPNCGGQLVPRPSTRGSFWGCSSFPHCRFTINKIDDQ